MWPGESLLAQPGNATKNLPEHSQRNMVRRIEVLADSRLWLSRCCRLGWRRSVTGVDSLIDLVCQSVAVEDNGDLPHSVQLGGKGPYVHSYVFRENRRTERCGKMILYENLSIILDAYLVNQMHLSYW